MKEDAHWREHLKGVLDFLHSPEEEPAHPEPQKGHRTHSTR
jgi:hypothetical protein